MDIRIHVRNTTAEKSNEITAMPDLLTLLDLHGALVSIDAMGCQKAIAHTIIDGGADDGLTLKDNQPTLCEEVQLWLDTEVARGHLPIQETIEKDHGRLEIRRYSVSSQIDGLEAKPDWAGLQAVGRVESTRLLRHNGPRATVSAVVNSAPPSTMITGCACSSASPVRLPHSAIALGDHRDPRCPPRLRLRPRPGRRDPVRLPARRDRWALAVVVSVLPDVDLPPTKIGRLFWFISVPLERRFDHRTLTHSAVMLLAVAVLAALLRFLNPLYFWTVVGGYGVPSVA